MTRAPHGCHQRIELAILARQTRNLGREMMATPPPLTWRFTGRGRRRALCPAVRYDQGLQMRLPFRERITHFAGGQAGESCRQIAKEMNVHHSTISRVRLDVPANVLAPYTAVAQHPAPQVDKW